VKVLSQYIKLRSNWLINPISAEGYRHWLINKTSLTLRLQIRYSDFHVQPISQQRAKPIAEEAKLLGLRHSETMQVRDVLLVGDSQQPLVFAHSILPDSSLQGDWYQLGKIGNKPLGEALFKNPRVIRTPLSYKRLSINDVLYQKAVKHVSTPPIYLWARRSIFSLNCAKILVSEVFLPYICHE
jgi:chorismate lyase